MLKSLSFFVFAGALVFGQNVSPSINTVPSRQFGQPTLPASLNSVAPNLVEGREVNQPYTVTFDSSVTPPILYVVDSSNNRVLGYKNPYSLANCGLNNPKCGFADLFIGPRPGDMQGTLPGGPGNLGPNTGFAFPTSAAVDSSGNLYVLDAGNNRILRFPSPAKQNSSLWQVDLTIGQKSFGQGTSCNQGQPVASATSLCFSLYSNQVFAASLTIEPSTGALWVTDPGNNRVLRFPASQLAANTSLPAADLVVGQTDFVSRNTPTPPTGTQAQLFQTGLYQPLGITFDQKGRLYISDGQSGQFYRVMVYLPGFGIGMAATRILGLVYQLTSTPVTFPNNYALAGPTGLFTTGNNLWVCDTGQNRVVEYDVYENWPAPPTITPGQNPPAQVSPPMMAVIGQNDLTSGKGNKGKSQPDNSTVFAPFGGTSNGTDIWIADTANNRVLDFPQQSGGKYITASRVIGQLDYGYNSPNLIEGREVNFSVGISYFGLPIGGGGIAEDHNSNPPHLYIADTTNNRILCFKDARSVGANNSVPADLVLGQPDVYHSQYNYPLNDPSTMSQSGLSLPADVLVDPAGNVWVADTGNGRILRFPPPFSQPAGAQILPNLVLGQFSFTGTPQTDPSPQTMAAPFGLAMFSNGSIAVSDAAFNRILIFSHGSGADFQNSQVASIVLGQQDFVSTSPGNGAGSLYSPRHISADTSDRLYVADPGNNRLIVFNGASSAGNGATSALQLPTFSQPQGVKVSTLTGEIWVADTNNRQLYRLPEYDTLVLNPTTVTARISTQTSPLAVELDNSDNVIIAEAANRVTFYFASLAWQNPTNFNIQPLAPGMLALLYRNGKNFSFTPTPYTGALPLPQSLGDIQVIVNGTPAPMYRLDPIDIAFQVPSNAPTSGTASVVVQHASTGEIIGAITAQMAPFNPGFFTAGTGTVPGTGLLAATNDDGSVNGPGNPISRDGTHFIIFYLTGGGAFPGVPDGNLPSSPVNTTVMPQFLSGAFGSSAQVPAADVKYSGSSFYPGVWQINFQVENKFPPGNNVIALTMNGFASSQGYGQTIQVYFVAK